MEIGNVAPYFKSYIVYDLETTTLPCYSPPKITEISVIALVRDHIEKHNAEELPRVLNKLNLCVYPQRIIPLDTERLTGLSNVLLQDQGLFNDKIFFILCEFIARMPQPACLIAHNGNRFDFPILQAEVHKLGKKFPDDLWCADSLSAFRYLYSNKPDQQLAKSSQESRTPKTSSDLEYMLKEDEEFDPVLCDVLDSIEKTVHILPSQEMAKYGLSCLDKEESPRQCSFGTLTDDIETNYGLSTPSSVRKMQKINETTPKRPSTQSNKKSVKNFPRHKSTCTPNPSDQHQKRLGRSGAIKCLADELNGIKAPKSFKLVDIYQHLCNREPLNAHTAEADSIMLLHSIIASRDNFLNWVDENAILFSGVKKMW